ncbi:MAG: hypothetical protein HY077_17295 [Elusimicrobia bacterium]|nr:hypothetical protein [Elusimicrobiota bacterium]
MISEFIQSQTFSLDKRPASAAPDPSHCQRIVKLAKVSVAGAAGLAEGDWLVSVDDIGADKLSLQFACDGSERRAYVFYCPASKEFVDLTASGVDIGVRLQLTRQAVAAGYKPGKATQPELAILWEAGDWENLERLAKLDVDTFGRGRTPALVFLGAAAYEQGREDDGYAIIGEYMKNYSRYWTTEYQAVGFYYMGKAQLKDGQDKEALETFMAAYEYNSYAPIMAMIEKLTGKKFRLIPRWQGERFPIDYDLPPLGGAGSRVSLAQTRARMKPGQVVAACLLGDYRGNGPYDEFMRHYLNFARWFGEFIVELHVVTCKADREADRPHWYKAEDRARALKIPIAFGLDAGRVVDGAVQPGGSPLNFVLDPEGRVLHHGELEANDLWDALAAGATSAARS